MCQLGRRSCIHHSLVDNENDDENSNLPGPETNPERTNEASNLRAIDRYQVDATRGTATRLSIDFDAFRRETSRDSDYYVRCTNSGSIEYLDKKLLENFCSWLRDQRLFHQLTHGMTKAFRLGTSIELQRNFIRSREPSPIYETNEHSSETTRRHGHEASNGPRLHRADWRRLVSDFTMSGLWLSPVNDQANGQNMAPISEEEFKQAKCKLIKVLRTSKALNILQLICHLILFVKISNMINSEFTIQNQPFPSTLSLPLASNHGQDIRLWTTEPPTTSVTIMAANERTLNYRELHSIGVGLISNYLLILIVALDFLNDLYWNKWRASIDQVKRNSSSNQTTFKPLLLRLDPCYDKGRWNTWLASILSIMLSPRHLLQAAQFGLLASLAPGFSSIAAGQSYWTLTMGILIGLQNGLNQMARHGYNLYKVNCCLRFLRVETTMEQVSGHENNGTVNKQRDEGGSPIEQDWDGQQPRQSNRTWLTQGPAYLKRLLGDFCRTCLREFERIQLISRLVNVKATIFLILMCFDSLELGKDGAVSFDCLPLLAYLFELFLAMHWYYERCHSKFVAREEEEKPTCRRN